MKWKLAAVWATAAVVIFVFVSPLITLHVEVQLPPGTASDPATTKMMSIAGIIAVYLIAAAVVGVVVWGARTISRRILRRKPS